MEALLANTLSRVRAFWDPSAWFMIVLGLLLFSLRIPLPQDGWVNLPVAMTVLQTGGLMFALFGMQLMASMAFWPSLSFGDLLKQVSEGSTSAALVLLGLFMFNGLCVIGFALWITSALGAGVGGR